MRYSSALGYPDEKFRRLAGVKKQTFEKMVAILTEAQAQKKARGGRPNKFQVPEMLMMALEYLREYRMYFHIAASYGLSKSNAYKLVNIDESDASLNIWCCGPSPSCMADSEGVRRDCHFNMGALEGGVWHGCGAVAADLCFKPGLVTVHRICSRTKELVAFTGEIFKKETCQGLSDRVRNFRMRGKARSIPGLLSVIHRYCVDRHMTFGYGDNEGAYREFAKWKGMAVGESAGYADYLE